MSPHALADVEFAVGALFERDIEHTTDRACIVRAAAASRLAFDTLGSLGNPATSIRIERIARMPPT